MKKKGFTLIELLAVIVILAIIALIAVPTVMNIIEKANKSAFEDTAYGIIKAGEYYYSSQLLNAEGMTEDTYFTIEDGKWVGNNKLDVNGGLPTDGAITVYKDGNVGISITNGKYLVTKGATDDNLTTTETTETTETISPVVPKRLYELATTTLTGGATEIEINACVSNGKNCPIGTRFAIKVTDGNYGIQSYVLDDNGKQVTLVLSLYNFNTSANPWNEENDNTNSGPITAIKNIKEITKDWINIGYKEYTYTDDGDGEKYNSFTTISKARLMTLAEANIAKNNHMSITGWTSASSSTGSNYASYYTISKDNPAINSAKISSSHINTFVFTISK